MSNHPYRFTRLAAILFACLLLGSVSLRAQQMQSPVQMPNPPVPVVDTADVIDAATEERLNNILKNLSENKAANAEFGVVTVKTTGGQDIFDYSLAIMRGWGVGSNEKGGLLLVVSVDDRKYFTQVSRHLEGELPDGLVGQIQRERLVPFFKQGNYSQGISDTVEAYVATLSQKRGFSIEGIDQRRAYRDTTSATRTTDRRTTRGFPMSTIIIIIVVVFFLLLSSRGRGGGGCGGGGCLNMLLLNSLLNSGRGGWGSSGWGGGGFGGGSGWGGGGGGGGDWGGFSGGGGDAGGGGAGGSW